jgi:hypothetical protein
VASIDEGARRGDLGGALALYDLVAPVSCR